MKPPIETHLFPDDGLVPNNPRLALKLYRRALDVTMRDPEAAIIAHFAANGWGGAWVDGIYPFQHYHARCHEVLGIARGEARVQLGGPAGPVLALTAGDAVLIPAGVGHCRMGASSDFSVVGAYPAGQEAYDLKRATVADHAAAIPEIPLVPLPALDPVLGAGPPW
jgi:uncharacterized protein YjlB